LLLLLLGDSVKDGIVLIASDLISICLASLRNDGDDIDRVDGIIDGDGNMMEEGSGEEEVDERPLTLPFDGDGNGDGSRGDD
jgi:hypothetical protein